MKEFFQRRLPVYNRGRVVLHAMMLLMTAVAAGLAYFGNNTFVVCCTALGATVVSWAEFADKERKLERYTTVVRSIKKLCSWWDSLGQVDRSSVPNITRLVVEGERIIGGELHVWSSTSE